MIFNLTNGHQEHIDLHQYIQQTQHSMYLIDFIYARQLAMKIIKERSKNKKVYLFYISSGRYDEARFVWEEVRSRIISDDDDIVIADILTSSKISRKFNNLNEIRRYLKSFITENESIDNVEHIMIVDSFSNTTKQPSSKTYQYIKHLNQYMDLTLALEHPNRVPKTYTIEKLMVFDRSSDVPSHTQFLKTFYNDYDFYECSIHKEDYIKAQKMLNVFYNASYNHQYQLNQKESSIINKDVIQNYIEQHVIIGDTHGY